ncbi:hypothetical protein TRVA0_046S00760 [Trichomonascus vanleenenianus]|uniref:uncharacterized protein n=1 Tax=Trichomonascus vanleenenianus TaxID=2268995 RepID=UPI003ECA293E
MLRRSAQILRPAVARTSARRCISLIPNSQRVPEPLTAEMAAEQGKNDDRLIGDYPHVPHEYYQGRNPHIKYDDQQQRRNFNEPLYHYYDVVDVWSPDRFDQVSDSTALKWVGWTVLAFAGLSAFVYAFVDHESPAVRRNYPHEGLYKALGGTEETKQVYQARQDN